MTAVHYLTRPQARAILRRHANPVLAEAILDQLPAVAMPICGQPPAYPVEIVEQMCAELARRAQTEAGPTEG